MIIRVPQILPEIASHVDASAELMASPMPEIRSEIQSKIEFTFLLLFLSEKRTCRFPVQARFSYVIKL